MDVHPRIGLLMVALVAGGASICLFIASGNIGRIGKSARLSHAPHGAEENAPEAVTSARVIGPSPEQIRGGRTGAELLSGPEITGRNEQRVIEPRVLGGGSGSTADSRVIIELDGGGYKTGEIVNGLPHGHWQVIDESGNIISEIPYEDGKIHGKLLSYDANGQLRGETEYVRGGVCGWVRGWHSTGHLAFEIESRGGAYNGTWREWYSDGTPERDAKAVAGMLDGACVFYLPNGHFDAARSGVYARGKRMHGI